MIFKFPWMHEEAYNMLREWGNGGDYSLTPHYESRKGSWRKRTLRKRVEEFFRKKFNWPSHYSLHGGVSDIFVAGERVHVNKGDLVELTLGYHPKLEHDVTYKAALFRLEFEIDREFHLSLAIPKEDLPFQTLFDPHLDPSFPPLSHIKSFSVVSPNEDYGLLPLHVRDSASMP